MVIFGYTIIKSVELKKLKEQIADLNKQIDYLGNIKKKYDNLTDRDEKGRFVKR